MIFLYVKDKCNFSVTNVKSPVVIVPLFLDFPLAAVQLANVTSANEKCSGNERHGGHAAQATAVADMGDRWEEETCFMHIYD